MLENLKEIWQRRHMVYIWTLYNLQARYINTRLVIVWILIQPLAMTLIYAFAFGTILGVRAPRGGVPFICFFISGVTIWTFFSSCITLSHSSVVSNIGMMTQIRFPREAVVLVRFCETVVDFLVTFVIMVGITAVYGYYPNTAYLFLPLIVLGYMLISLGLMFLFGSLSVYIRDIPQLISIALRLLFYISGVIFSIDMLPEGLQRFVYVNPLAIMIQSFRDIILYAETPSLFDMGYILFVGLIFFLIGYGYFKQREKEFADYL